MDAMISGADFITQTPVQELQSVLVTRSVICSRCMERKDCRHKNEIITDPIIINTEVQKDLSDEARAREWSKRADGKPSPDCSDLGSGQICTLCFCTLCTAPAAGED